MLQEDTGNAITGAETPANPPRVRCARCGTEQLDVAGRCATPGCGNNYRLARIRPTQDRVLVREPVALEGVTPGGIITPATASEASREMEVLAVGPGRRSPKTGARVPMAVKVGDRVVMARYPGQKLEHLGESIILARETEVLAVLD